MKTFLLLAVAALCFGATESRIPRSALVSVEGSMNDRFRGVASDPYDLLGTARGTYLDGYGAVFTVELELIYAQPPSPFHPAYSPAELASLRERKLKKLPVMKETMRALMAGASSTLETLPGNERITMEAILWNYSWEETRGLPRRVHMTAEKDKLRRAVAEHTDLASVIEEWEQ